MLRGYIKGANLRYGEYTMRQTAFFALTLFALSPLVVAQEMELPKYFPQPSPQQVVDENLEALNACAWTRLMAQYPPERGTDHCRRRCIISWS